MCGTSQRLRLLPGRSPARRSGRFGFPERLVNLVLDRQLLLFQRLNFLLSAWFDAGLHGFDSSIHFGVLADQLAEVDHSQ